MKRCDKLTKTIQKRLYDFLLTKHGLSLLCLSILLVILCIIQLSDTILEYRLANLISLNNSSLFELKLNSKQSFSNEDADILPKIDVVYTWVNGSDPEHLKELKKYKFLNHNNSLQSVQVEFKEYLENSNKTWPCYHKLCMQTNNLIIITPKLSQSDKHSFLINAKNLLDPLVYSNLTLDSSDSVYHQEALLNDRRLTTSLSILYLNNFDLKQQNNNKTEIEKLDFLFKKYFLNKNYRLFMGYYTIDCNLALNCIKNLNRTFIIKKVKTAAENQNINYQNRLNQINKDFLAYMAPGGLPKENKLELPRNISENLIYKLDYMHVPSVLYDGSQKQNVDKNKKGGDSSVVNKNGIPLAVFRVKTRELNAYLSRTRQIWFLNENGQNISYDLYKANIVWDLGDPFYEDISENRFQDNQELKYSLRSLEKYAPWVRNVFLVTNGQVPNWLNLSHPKIKIITHNQIFENKSHLPTFSSPAIETHLHRIPGLSKRFLYFNDDVLLGKPIWPDDFFTHSKGFKFHLAWSLPGCNPHCPNSWIRDGYCDKSCNTTECDFDGGDCDMSIKKQNPNIPYDNARQAFINQSQILFPEFYCSPGCSTSWLADKYCDNACNNLNCAFDMADCGIEKFPNELYQITLSDLKPGEIIFSLPKNLSSFYLNFTNKFKILKANYEENQLVRTISVVNKYGIMTVLLMPLSFQSKINENKLNTIRIYLESSLTNSTSDENSFNSTLIFTLNSLNQTSTPKMLEYSTKTTKRKIKIKFTDLEPKIVPLKTVETNISLFNNSVFKNLYENYRSYLNWSVNSGFLSQEGFKYKIDLFSQKFSTENLDSDLEKVFNFLFNSEIKFFNDFERNNLLNEYLNQTAESDDNIFIKFRKRKLLDTFADSLKHVNRLFNKVYGYTARKVPAHMPHFIDKQIMHELQKKFSENFEKTSQNRFRTAQDMQYAFSYYYFVMSELEEFNSTKLFDEFDLNSNRVLDHSEIILINLRLSPRPFSASSFVPHEAPVSDMYKLEKEFSDNLKIVLILSLEIYFLIVQV